MKIKPASSIIDNKTNDVLEMEAGSTDIPRYAQVNNTLKPSVINGKKVTYYKSLENSDTTFEAQAEKDSNKTAYTKVTNSISSQAGLDVKENKVYNGDETEYVNRLKNKRNFVNSGKRDGKDENLEINKTLGLKDDASITAYVDSKTQQLGEGYSSDIKSRLVGISKKPNETLIVKQTDEAIEDAPEKKDSLEWNIKSQNSDFAKDETKFSLGGKELETFSTEYINTTEDVFNTSKRFKPITSKIDGGGLVNSSYYGSQDDEPSSGSWDDLLPNAKTALAKSTLGLGVSKDLINKVAEPIMGFFGIEGNEEVNALSLSMTSLEHWKGERAKTFHTKDWKPKNTLNTDANAAGSMASDLRGELGRTTGGLGGIAAKSGNSWLTAGGQLVDMTVGAGLTNTITDITGSFAKGVGDGEWQPEVDELANLNTVTKDTIYTSKPGIRFKAKSGMVQNVTSNQDSVAIFGKSGYTKNGDSLRNTYGTSLDLLRGNQLNATRTSKIRRMILNEDNEFKKKRMVYNLKEEISSGGSLYNYQEDSNGFFYWEKSDDLYTNFNLSSEEAQLITLIKNRNTYNKTLGYIYIRPYYNYVDDKTKQDPGNGLGLFDIPFEFTPNIQESATQANYQQETLLGRLGQFQIFTGTNLPTVSIELQYMALAPDSLDEHERQGMNKEWGTDAWQYYWTNNRIEAIEMKLRSLVFADYVSGDYLIKPPLVEIHLENARGQNAETVGDLYKYPIGSNNPSKVGERYLQYSTSIHGSARNRYKKYIVTSVQIDKISDSDIIYPSLYGRVYDSSVSSSNPMWHVKNAVEGETRADEKTGTYGYSGYARKKGFKATLSLTEVTENFLDLVPDFKAYYDAWTLKESAADIVSQYAETTIGNNSMVQSAQSALQDALSIAKNTLISSEERLDAMFEEYEKLAKLYAKSFTTKTKGGNAYWKIGMFNDRDGGDVEKNKFNFISAGNPKVNINDKNKSEEEVELTMNALLNNLSDGGVKANISNFYRFYTDINYDKTVNKPINYEKDLKGIEFYDKSDVNNNLYRFGEQSLLNGENPIPEAKPAGVYDFLQIGNGNKYAWMVDKNGYDDYQTKYGHIDSAASFVIAGDIIAEIKSLSGKIKELVETTDKSPTQVTIKGQTVNDYVDSEVSIIESKLNTRKQTLEEVLDKTSEITLYGKSVADAINSVGEKDKKFVELANNFISSNEPTKENVKNLYNLCGHLQNNKNKLSKIIAGITVVVGDNNDDNPNTSTEMITKNPNPEVNPNNCTAGTYPLFGDKSIMKLIEGKNFNGFINETNRYDITSTEAIIESSGFKDKEVKRLNTYLEKFDTRKSFIKAEKRCMFKNILTLIGVFSDSKIKGIKASNQPIIKEKGIVSGGDVFSELTKEDLVIWADADNEKVIENPLTFSTFSSKYSVISLKKVFEAIVEGYNTCRNLLLELVDENKDLVGGIPTDGIEAIDIKGELKKALLSFSNEVTGHGTTVNSDGTHQDADESKAASTANEDKSIEPQIKDLFDTIKEKIITGFTKMEKLVFICEHIFSRSSIEQRMNEFYNEENDKNNSNKNKKEDVKKENISGGANNASGAKYFSYGMDNEAERGAKKDNDGTSACLPCYKTNKGTSLLKEVEFNGRDEEFAKGASDGATHGAIYRAYVDQQKSRALAAKLDTANGTFAYETYNKLSS